MGEFLRVAVFALLFMAQMTVTKSSILKTKLRVNKRSLLPWQHINLGSMPNGRQEIRMVSSPCDGLTIEKCQEKLQPIKDKAFQEFEFVKKSATNAGQATSPPIGWWIYANGRPRSGGKRNARAITSRNRPFTIKDVERTVIEPLQAFEFEKKSATNAGQATSPPMGWWIYANGRPPAGKRNTRAITLQSRPSTIKDTKRSVIDEFVEYLTLKHHEV